MKRLLAGLSLFSALAAVLTLLWGAGQREQTLLIGFVAPLTGDQAYIGEGVLNGALMAIEDANVKGPVFGNTKLKLIPLDDQHNPTQAVLAANKLVANSDVVGVVGHFNSSCTKPASAIYYEGRVAQVSPASTNPEISRQGFDTFFRVCATDDVQGPAAAKFVFNQLNARKIIIIDDKTTYGQGLADQFEKEFIKLGGTVLSHDGITQGEKDFTPLLTRLKSMHPEMIYFGGVYPELSLLLKESKKMGLDAPWMGGDGIFDVSLIRLATPEMSEGTYATMLGVDPKSLPSARDFVARYEARYGEIGSFSAYGYDAASVLVDAVRRAGSRDREAVLAAVHETRDFEGVLGTINFDEKGDAVGKSVGIFQVRGGKFVFLEEFQP